MPHRRVFLNGWTTTGPSSIDSLQAFAHAPRFPRLRCSDLSVGQPFRRSRASKKEKMCVQAVRIGYFCRERIICSLF